MPDSPTPKRRGRPRVDPTQKNITLHVQVTPATYDRLWGKATRAGVTIPELLRRALERQPDAGR